MWPAAMQSLLIKIGPDRYGYPRVIHDEPCRADEIRNLSGAAIESVRPVVVQSVDFKNWKTWEDYFGSLNTNAKRNYKRAIKEIDRLNIVTKRGLSALTELACLAKCMQNVNECKGLTHSVLRFAAGFVVKAALLGDRQFVSVVRSGTKRLAAISGVEFGDSLFYLEGGRSVDQPGAQWYLVIEALKEFRRRRPDGVFVMGYVDYALHDEAVGGGLLRFRAACQVTNVATSIVKFDFDPAAIGEPRPCGRRARPNEPFIGGTSAMSRAARQGSGATPRVPAASRLCRLRRSSASSI